MPALGLSGEPDLVNENPFNVPRPFVHDAAAVLVEDGEGQRWGLFENIFV